MHVFEESDSGIVPMNHSNKDGKPLAESEEGRPLIKENTHQSSTPSTQSGDTRVPGVGGCASSSEGEEGEKFTALLHHLTVGSAAGKLLRFEAKSCAGSGRRHLAGV